MKKILMIYGITLLGLSLHYAEASTLATPKTATVQAVVAKGGSQAQSLTFHQAKDNNQWLLASERQGLLLQSVPSSGSLPAPKVLVKGEFELLAFSDPYVLTLDRRADRIRPIMLKQVNGEPTTNVLPLLPMGSFEIHWICIQPRQQDGNIYAWFGGENGQSEQWLLGNAGNWSPKLMRSQAILVNSTDCAIEGDKLYVSEPEAGVWQFDASPFADSSGKLVHPTIDNQITGIAVVNGKLLLGDKKGKITDTLGNQLATLSANKAKRLSLAATHDQQNQSVATLAVFDDQTDHYLFAQASLPSEIIRTEATHTVDDHIVEIPAWVESAPSDRPYDTMDDPAIWVHPTAPEKSLILGTNKRWGLVSFNMQGEQVQGLPSGRINNVDLRQQVQLGGKKRDIAVATLRDNDSLAFYEIDSAGKITEYPNQATNMVDIYGMCLYQDGQD
ncbi:MAG: phytase, partial [Shewanella sp.]